MIALVVIGMQTVSAQSAVTSEQERQELQELRDFKKRSLLNKGYTNISYSKQELTDPVSGLGRTADIGAAISRGRTFVLHREPIASMVFVGLDATWIDINYAQYKAPKNSDALSFHQADFGMGIGPSVHVLPIGKLGIHAYFRYHPTFATGISTEDGFEIQGGYSSVFTTGGAVSWSFISLGAEARWGTGNYKKLFGGDEESVNLGKLKTSGMRIYLSFRY